MDRKISAWLTTAALLLATAGCSYRDMGVGKSKDMTPQEAEDYAKSTYGELPVPIEDRPGFGPVVQPDRMVTVDFVFNDTGENESHGPESSRMRFFLGAPPWRGRVRFLYRASGASQSGETFGYISPGHATPALLAAMAGMREGGTRSVRLTDFCDDHYHTNICQTGGNEWDKTKAGERRLGVWYPRATPLLVNITIIRVCRPTIIVEHTPDVMGGGAGQNIKETSCR